MSNRSPEMDDWARAWWGWFAGALFLLIPVDLLTTLVAVGEYGAGVETNPLMRWLLTQGLVEVTIANLLAVAVAVFLFDAVVGAVTEAPAAYRQRMAYGLSAWVGLAFAAGVVLIGNNLLLVL